MMNLDTIDIPCSIIVIPKPGFGNTISLYIVCTTSILENYI